MNPRVVKIGLALAAMLFASGCAGVSDSLNPFTDSVDAELGQRNTSALGGGAQGKNAEQARHALEVMGTYQRASAPQPYYPVVRPADVRLMWIPDHVNRLGDLVPAHYYYLRVMRDDWEVKDAFEVERLLNSRGPTGYAGSAGGIGAPAAAATAPAVGANPLDQAGPGGATPWQYKEQK